MIKLICFDLWNTLASKKTNFTAHATDELIKSFKLKLPKQKVVKIFEETIQTKYWEVEYEAYKQLAINLEINPTKDNVLKIMQVRQSFENAIELYSFTIPLLTKLKSNGYKIGLISNSSVFVYDQVKQTSLLELIDYPIFSYMLNAIKPDPIMFLEMQRLSNITNPKEIIMIGDNLFDDINPAKELAWNTIHFDGDYKSLEKELKKLDVKI
ncbi:MAG: HAD family hydrolase [archaeon]